MKSPTLFGLALSFSLVLVSCSPQTAQPLLAPQPAQPLAQHQADSAASQGRSPAQAPMAGSEAISFSLKQPEGFKTQLVEFERLAFIRLTVVGEGIRGSLSSGQLIPVVDGHADATIDKIPLSPGKLRVATIQGYDAEGHVMPSFVGKGFYRSKAGVTRIVLSIDRRHWLSGRALEILLKEAPGKVSGVDLEALQLAVDQAIGFTGPGGYFTTEPREFNPFALSEMLAAGDAPSGQDILNEAQAVPGELDLPLSTPHGGNFLQNYTLVIDDPNSSSGQITSGTASPYHFMRNLPMGEWTLEVRDSNGVVVGSTTISVDAEGLVEVGDSPLVLDVPESTVITGLSPSFDVITGDSQITISGVGFTGATQVTFGATGAAFVVDSDTQITATVPAGSIGTVRVSVTSPQGTSPDVAADDFTYEALPASVNNYTRGNQQASAMAMNSDGEMVVVWSGAGPRDEAGIYAQRYDSSGAKAGNQFLVNQATSGTQAFATVGIDEDGDFVVAWTSYEQPGEDYGGIYARRFNAGGVAQGSEFHVNTSTTHIQYRPRVGIDADGDFLIAWETYQDLTMDIYARRYSAAGASIGGETKLADFTNNYFGLAMDADGDFVIAYDNQAQRFNSAMVSQGGEFTTGVGSCAMVDMDADGNFVVAGMSYGGDGSSWGIKAIKYLADGTPHASGLQNVNNTTLSMQQYPSVALDDSGDFMVTWESFNPYVSSYDVYARRYNSSGTADGQEFLVNDFTQGHQTIRGDQNGGYIGSDGQGSFTIIWTSYDQLFGDSSGDVFMDTFSRRAD